MHQDLSEIVLKSSLLDLEDTLGKQTYLNHFQIWVGVFCLTSCMYLYWLLTDRILSVKTKCRYWPTNSHSGNQTFLFNSSKYLSVKWRERNASKHKNSVNQYVLTHMKSASSKDGVCVARSSLFSTSLVFCASNNASWHEI